MVRIALLGMMSLLPQGFVQKSLGGLLQVDSQLTTDVITFSDTSFRDANLLRTVNLDLSGGVGASRTGPMTLVSSATGLGFSTSSNLVATTDYVPGATTFHTTWTMTNPRPGYVEYSYSVDASPTYDPAASLLGRVVDPGTDLIGLQITAADLVHVDLTNPNTLQLILPTGWGMLTSSPTPFFTQIVGVNLGWTIDTSLDPSGFYDDGSNTYLSLTNASSDGSASGLSLILWGDRIQAIPVAEPGTIFGLGFGFLVLIRGRSLHARRSKK